MQATARACAVAIYEIGLDKLCGQRKLFINASGEWLLNPDLGGLPQSQIVIEILEDTEVNDVLLSALRKLKHQGYTLALDDFELTDANRALLALADIVKFDISTGLPTALIQRLYKEGYTLLAERVETYEEFEKCKALGFSLFQGYFYQRPQVQTSCSHSWTSKEHSLGSSPRLEGITTCGRIQLLLPLVRHRRQSSSSRRRQCPSSQSHR